VIGAGPSGLPAAFHLMRLGHQVEIQETGSLPDGILHFGIPAYRRPRDALMQEIVRIEDKVEDVLAETASGRFDAVLVAIGAQAGRHIDLDTAHAVTAGSLLHDVGVGGASKLGRRVVIYGTSDRRWVRRGQLGPRLGSTCPYRKLRPAVLVVITRSAASSHSG
jgi:formate dehydrogenase (NADP+) beta subunit